ncbi:spermidine synthase [Colwelliaceae bacterium 6471]
MLSLIVIFLSAFLLFQVQPIIAKIILPVFGGGAAVWTACLLFFQAFLLLGYFYAHAVTQIKKLRYQVAIHAVLLITSLIWLPTNINALTIPELGDSPLYDILLLLVGLIGLPYFLLSTTGPLVQRWLSFAEHKKLPYKLYSLSNVGSLLALLTYPFVFEPQLALSEQTLMWSIAYGVFVVAIVVFSLSLLRRSVVIKHEHLNEAPKVKLDWLLWLFLSATGVVLLVATTNAMTQNIPPMPFLWILPLCIYLLTFIISFHSPRWYVRWYWFLFFAISSIAAVLMFFIASHFDIISQIIIYSFILLSACMICHGELAKLKPNVGRLTLFYLCMSLGGFLGSAFVAFVAQQVFDQFLEFPIAIITVYILLFLSILAHRRAENVAPHKIASHNAIVQPHSRLILGACGVLALTTLSLFTYLNSLYGQSDIVNSRNFYGVLSVKDVDLNSSKERRLIDGTTSHGTQSLEVGFEDIPMSYYRKNTGAALALEHIFPQQNINVGLIGLGAGTLAAYGRRGDEYRFYELNPAVKEFAYEYFTYLENSDAYIDVIVGDARVSLTQELEQQGDNQFQVLVVDAFSGDSIPAHLLTIEALNLYWQHLLPDGLLVFHISNSHLDLKPLIKGLADSFKMNALYFRTEASERDVNTTEWAIITNNQAFITNYKVKKYLTPWPESDKENIVWTDNYSNLLSVLK